MSGDYTRRTNKGSCWHVATEVEDVVIVRQVIIVLQCKTLCDCIADDKTRVRNIDELQNTIRDMHHCTWDHW